MRDQVVDNLGLLPVDPADTICATMLAVQEYFREKRELIDKALSELTPQQRQSIELAYFKGLSQSEISRQMDEPLGTIKSWMRTGMIKLREILI